MRYLAVLALAGFSIALQAQSGDGPALQPGQEALYAQERVQVSAQLTGKVDSKNAKVGDRISAQTTIEARLSDGTRLPRGTRMTGQVLEVHATSSEDNTSHLTLTLDRVILHDGREIPMHAMFAAVAAPSPGANVEAMSETPIGGGAMAGGSASSGGRANAGGGGLGGGTARTANGIGGRVTQPSANGAVELPDETHVVRNAGESAGSASVLERRHVPVGNMPGVTLSSTFSAGNSGSLDAKGRNIDLESGTRLMLNVWAPVQ